MRYMLKILVLLKFLTKDLYLTFENFDLYEGVQYSRGVVAKNRRMVTIFLLLLLFHVF